MGIVSFPYFDYNCFSSAQVKSSDGRNLQNCMVSFLELLRVNLNFVLETLLFPNEKCRLEFAAFHKNIIDFEEVRCD